MNAARTSFSFSGSASGSVKGPKAVSSNSSLSRPHLATPVLTRLAGGVSGHTGEHGDDSHLGNDEGRLDLYENGVEHRDQTKDRRGKPEFDGVAAPVVGLAPLLVGVLAEGTRRGRGRDEVDESRGFVTTLLQRRHDFIGALREIGVGRLDLLPKLGGKPGLLLFQPRLEADRLLIQLFLASLEHRLP